MTRRFVVSTSALTTEQEKQLKEEFTGTSWWHWLPNFWLVKDRTGKLDSMEIVKAVQRIAGRGTQCIVLEVDHKRWATLERPDDRGRRMSDWLKSTWTQN